MTQREVEQYLLHYKPLTSNTFMDYIPYLRFPQILRVEIRLNQWQRLIAVEKIKNNFFKYCCTLCELKGMIREHVQQHLFEKRHQNLLRQNVEQVFHPDYTYPKVLLDKLYEKKIKSKEVLNTEKLTQNAGNVYQMKVTSETNPAEGTKDSPLKDEKFTKILMALRSSMKSSSLATESYDANKITENDEELSSSRDAMFKDIEEKDDTASSSNELRKRYEENSYETSTKAQVNREVDKNKRKRTPDNTHKLKTDNNSKSDIKTSVLPSKDDNFERILNRLRRSMGTTSDSATKSNNANTPRETTTTTSKNQPPSKSNFVMKTTEITATSASKTVDTTKTSYSTIATKTATASNFDSTNIPVITTMKNQPTSKSNFVMKTTEITATSASKTVDTTKTPNSTIATKTATASNFDSTNIPVITTMKNQPTTSKSSFVWRNPEITATSASKTSDTIKTSNSTIATKTATASNFDSTIIPVITTMKNQPTISKSSFMMKTSEITNSACKKNDMTKTSESTTATNRATNSNFDSNKKCNYTTNISEPTTLSFAITTLDPTLVTKSNNAIKTLETTSTLQSQNKHAIMETKIPNTNFAAVAAIVDLNETEIKEALAPAGYLNKKKLKDASDISEPQAKRQKISIKLPSIKVLPTAKLTEDSDQDAENEETTIDQFSSIVNNEKKEIVKKVDEKQTESKPFPKIRLVSIEKLMEKRETTKETACVNSSASYESKEFDLNSKRNDKNTEQTILKEKSHEKIETNLDSKPTEASIKAKTNLDLTKTINKHQKLTDLNSEKLTVKNTEKPTDIIQPLSKVENVKKNVASQPALDNNIKKKISLQPSLSTQTTTASKNNKQKKNELPQTASNRHNLEKQNVYQSASTLKPSTYKVERNLNPSFGNSQPTMGRVNMQPPHLQQRQFAMQTIVDDETHKRMVESFLAANNNKSSTSNASRASRLERSPTRSFNNSKKVPQLNSSSRLRTPSPTKNSKHNKKVQKKSISRSPTRLASDAAKSPKAQPKEVHLNPRHPIWSKYCRYVDRDIKALKIRYEKYKTNPELHPSYEDEWQKFWQKRKSEIIAQNKDYRTYDYKADWVPYFKKRIQQFYEEASDSLKIKLREKLSLPLSNRCVLNKKYHVKTNVERDSSSKKTQKISPATDVLPTRTKSRNDANDEQKTPTFVSVLRLLIALEENLGSFKQRIVVLLEKVLQAEKSSPSEGIALINDENCTLLELIVEKFKGLILLDSTKERVLKKAITQVSLFLKVALQLKEKTKELILKRATENIGDTFTTPFDLQHSKQFATVLNFSTQPHVYPPTYDNYSNFVHHNNDKTNMYAMDGTTNWQQQQQQQQLPAQQQFYHAQNDWNPNANQTWGVAPWPAGNQINANPSPLGPGQFSQNYYC